MQLRLYTQSPFSSSCLLLTSSRGHITAQLLSFERWMKLFLYDYRINVCFQETAHLPLPKLKTLPKARSKCNFEVLQLTLEKSNSLGTKSRRKRLWDNLGERRSKQTVKRNLVRNVIAWIGFNRTKDSKKIQVIVLDDQKSRELRRIRNILKCSWVMSCHM